MNRHASTEMVRHMSLEDDIVELRLRDKAVYVIQCNTIQRAYDMPMPEGPSKVASPFCDKIEMPNQK